MKGTVLSIIGFLTLTAHAQFNPGVRNAHGLVYHMAEKAIYLFGGATESQVKGDLWKWKNGTWQLIEAEGPTGRTFPAMAYDSQNEQIILFGGSKVLFGQGPDPANLLNDTWIYKQGKWIEITSGVKPNPRAEAASCYDSLRNKVVLFGGYEIAEKDYQSLGDTWEFIDGKWLQVSIDGPQPRVNPAMSFDTSMGESVLFGGSMGKNGYGDGKGETWTWNGDRWRKLEQPQPINIYNATMVCTDEGLIRYGGWDGKKRTMALYKFRADGWQEVETNPAPHHRNHTQMVYEAHESRSILYGGHDGRTVFGDLWSYHSGKWTKLSGVRPLERVRNGH